MRNLAGWSSRLRRLLATLLVTGLAWGYVPPSAASRVATRPASPTLDDLRSAGAALVRDVYRYAPPSTATDQPLRVLVALHGMGGNGQDFAAPLLPEADRHHWLLVAPTIQYGDWTDPAQIAREDPALVAWLSSYLAGLSADTPRAVEPRVLLFGHSRGAQLALRFAEIHSEQVAGVAAEAAGTYTLPVAEQASTGRELDFPFGIADLARIDGGRAFSSRGFARVPVWIGVGAQDDNPADVPHAWDAYIGLTRVDRATAFTAALRALGAAVSLTVFASTDHTLTDEVRAAACAALARMSAPLQRATRAWA